MWEKLLLHILEHHRGKLLGIGLGLIAGILVVSYGFWKALFIIICIVLGYLVGKNIDERTDWDDWVQRVFKNR